MVRIHARQPPQNEALTRLQQFGLQSACSLLARSIGLNRRLLALVHYFGHPERLGRLALHQLSGRSLNALFGATISPLPVFFNQLSSRGHASLGFTLEPMGFFKAKSERE